MCKCLRKPDVLARVSGRDGPPWLRVKPCAPVGSCGSVCVCPPCVLTCRSSAAAVWSEPSRREPRKTCASVCLCTGEGHREAATWLFSGALWKFERVVLHF